MGALWFFNEARRKLFPRAHQHFLFDGLQQIKTTTCAFPTRNQVPAYEDFKKGRGSIFVPTPLEKAAFKTAAAPIHDWYLNKFGDEWLYNLENAVAQCNASVLNEFLTKLNRDQIISIQSVNYAHFDPSTQKYLDDFGAMIVYQR